MCELYAFLVYRNDPDPSYKELWRKYFAWAISHKNRPTFKVHFFEDNAHIMIMEW